MRSLSVLELNFNEPKIKVLNLKLFYNSNTFWRTGIEIYFLYKLHFTLFPRSLRPSFPNALLDFDFPIRNLQKYEEKKYFLKLKERVEYFFECFLKICGVELQTLKEYHDFLDPSIETCEFPKELDSADYNILPVKEWFPATSRFIRSSISRIRQRSPSPHLDLDAVEIKVKSFEDEKRLALQRIRLADFEPHRTDLIEFKFESEIVGMELGQIYKETNEFDQRKELLEASLKNLSYFSNTLSGCKLLINEMNSIFSDDLEYFGSEIVENGNSVIQKINDNLDKIDDKIKYPLNVQLEDVYSLTRGINERIFALKHLSTAISEQKRSCDQLNQLQTESIIAMDRAQGSLANLTSSSEAFDRKIAAKNAEIERRIQKVQECSNDFTELDNHISKQLEKWELISDTFLMEKFKGI